MSAVIAVALTWHSAALASDAKYRFDIRKQTVGAALLEFAQQARVPVLFPSGIFADINANPVIGEYSVEEALDILLEGTAIDATVDNSGQLVVRFRQQAGSDAATGNEDSMAVATAQQAEPGGNQSLTASSASFGNAAAANEPRTRQSVLQEIAVTGTRIRNTDGMNSPVPVTVLTTAELSVFDPGGSIAEQLDALPQFFGTATAQRGQGTLYQGTGGGYLDLRGLGSQRTLVLFDGARVVPADKRGSVNVETLPTALIRTVDVVTGGASAAYGADALGGVTNFVLDREFEGLRLQSGGGLTERGDGERWNFALAGGKRIGERLNVIGSVEARHINQIQRDPEQVGDWFQRWGWVTNPAWSPGAPMGVPQRLTLPWVTSSEHSPSGVIWARRGSSSTSTLLPFALNGMTFTDDGSAVRPFVRGDVYAAPGLPGSTKSMAGGPEALNHMRAFAGGPVGRETVGRSGFAALQYQFTDSVSAFAQVLAGRSESVFNAERGYHQLMDGWYLTVYRDNAFLPAQVAAAMDAAGISSFQLHKGGSYIGSNDINHDSVEKVVMGTWSWSMGLDAVLPNDWHLRASWQSGESHKRSGAYDEIRTDRLFLAADAVRDPATGAIVCNVQRYNPTPAQLQQAVAGRHASPGGSPDPAAGPLLAPIGLDNTIRDCTPINIMGAGGLSVAANDYINTPKIADDYVNQDFAELLLSGDLAKGWAGAVTFATGLTWREQSFADRTLPVAIDLLGPPLNAPELGIRGFPPSYTGGSANLHQHSSHPVLNGSYDVWEWFTELNVPLWQAGAGARRIDGSAAWRASDYSNIGTIESWKLGLDLQLSESLRLRTTRSRDVREASFSERFDQQGGGGSVTDPRFNNATFQITSRAGGNPDLRPEMADTLVAGLVWQPSRVEGLRVATDWYDVRIKGAVGTLGVQRIIDECELNGVQELCAQYDRDPVTGFIGTVRNTFLNVAQARVEGVDLEVSYTAEPDWLPNVPELLDIRALAGKILERSDTPFGGTPFDVSGALETPELTAIISASYTLGAYRISLQQRHIAPTHINPNWVEGRDVDDNRVASGNYTNLQLGYGAELDDGRTWNLGFNVSNLLDRPPPVIPNYSTRGGAQLVNPNYDTYGRRYQLSFNLNY